MNQHIFWRLGLSTKRNTASSTVTLTAVPPSDVDEHFGVKLHDCAKKISVTIKDFFTFFPELDENSIDFEQKDEKINFIRTNNFKKIKELTKYCSFFTSKINSWKCSHFANVPYAISKKQESDLVLYFLHNADNLNQNYTTFRIDVSFGLKNFYNFNIENINFDFNIQKNIITGEVKKMSFSGNRFHFYIHTMEHELVYRPFYEPLKYNDNEVVKYDDIITQNFIITLTQKIS